MPVIAGDPPVFAACFNDRYLPHAATMIRSFAASAVTPSRWYLIADESVEPGELRQLLNFARSCGITAEPLDIPDELVAPFEDKARYPRSAWYRTALADALPGEGRLVYLDSDLIVLHDLKPLWETSLGEGHLFAALCTPSYAGSGVLNNERLGLPYSAGYFNSGVMVMDLALMRAEGFRERTAKYVQTTGRPELIFADQDALNVVFAGRWTPIDPKWNCLGTILLPFMIGGSWSDDIHHDRLVLERAARSPGVVHFDGPAIMKPWNKRCFNPFAPLYREYRAMTPWPLGVLEGRPRDAVLSKVPPRVQAKVWQYRLRRRRRRATAKHAPRTTR